MVTWVIDLQLTSCVVFQKSREFFNMITYYIIEPSIKGSICVISSALAGCQTSIKHLSITFSDYDE